MPGLARLVRRQTEYLKDSTSPQNLHRPASTTGINQLYMFHTFIWYLFTPAEKGYGNHGNVAHVFARNVYEALFSPPSKDLGTRLSNQ